MIIIAGALLKAIVDAAEAAYPQECCGLLVGRDEGACTLVVTDVQPSRNLATGREHDSFEVDPQLRFSLMRRLNGTSERLVGHYHSHPDHAARPSARDLAMAYEPDLIWVIVSVCHGQAIHVSAHAIAAPGGPAREVALVTEAPWVA